MQSKDFVSLLMVFGLGESSIRGPLVLTTTLPDMFIERRGPTTSGARKFFHGGVVTEGLAISRTSTRIDDNRLPANSEQYRPTTTIIRNHNTGGRTTVPISRIFDRFRDMPTSNTQPVFEKYVMQLLGARTVCAVRNGKKCSITALSSTTDDVNELPPSSEHYSHFADIIRRHDMRDVNFVPIFTIFERFRNLSITGLKSNYVTHSGIPHGMASKSSLPLVNHAYLCLDIENCIIRPDIINFRPNGAKDTHRYHLGREHSGGYTGYTHGEEESDHPRFIQMYIYDTNNEVNNKMRHFGGLDGAALNPEIIEGLIHVLDEHNGLVKLFRTARDRCSAGKIQGFKIRLYNIGGMRGYELLTLDILGGIAFESASRSRIDFDLIIEFRGGPPKRINKLHQPYMSLQFPLLFVFGETGFYLELMLKPRNGRGQGKRGDHEGITVGFVILLPSTFTGGPRSIGEPSTSTSGNNKKIDEIQNYVDGRFICPYEACWRIFDFPIHSQEPAVQILNVHLENMQRITFGKRDRHLTYLNFLSDFVWYPDFKRWPRRQIATKKSLGRLTYVHPSSCELFYFGMLLCHQKGCKSPIEDLRLQSPPENLLKDIENKLLMEEKNYNRELLMQDAVESIPKLNREQNKIYDLIMNACTRNEQELLFVYGHGGTRKTFMWKTIISSLHSQRKIVLTIASFGIASLLLPAVHTAHSIFKLPLELTDESLCYSEILAKWLLDVGNGEIGEPDEQDDQDSCWITIPPEYHVSSDTKPLP
nr:helitron helicase-like domain-containing protein [Tanacetum cinerariifolium]